VSRFARFLAFAALATSLILGGLWLTRGWSSADPLTRGLNAYARNDWEAAAALARQRLKVAGNDLQALRLLARASVRLRRDSSAMAMFERIGPKGMSPEDLCLLGIALTRSGNAQAGLQVWEQAHSAEPDHAETLWELTLAYSASDRLSEATATARRLAERPGWKAKADALLGAIELDHDDASGAIKYWKLARSEQVATPGDHSAPIVPPKEMARVLLRAGHPADARLELSKLLGSGTDPEASWLLSRAFLQEGAKVEALAALEAAGSFRDENPLVPEPAAFVGSARCAKCHSTIHQAQQSSRHARTFFRADELKDLELPAPSFADPGRPGVAHNLERAAGGPVQQKTQIDGKILSAVVVYAFGSGDRGLTLVGRDDHGQYHELRLSRYSAHDAPHWNVTAGQSDSPSKTVEFLGRPLDEDGVRRCLLCHVTSPRSILESSGPCATDRAIGCEKCHGPGGNHLLAIEAEFPDRAIVQPSMASGARLVKMCGQCHSPRGGEVLPEDPASVRFQATTLTWSRCFAESQNELDCMTCHDPHRNASTDLRHYETKCLNCHRSASPPAGRAADEGRGTKSSPGLARTKCPVNPASGCITCHMPAVKDAVPHSTFTDHDIRVHRR
jgi:tetratricopeptide (TPR) repeat protein